MVKRVPVAEKVCGARPADTKNPKHARAYLYAIHAQQEMYEQGAGGGGGEHILGV